ncbi:hypothetical protein [Clostridium estertheticum]|uniref:hypothetical protein n=1 Tax=Clostridium estertheticum TaxID=238834 RepID=UPI001C0CF027|nr:hypothetical protein [Clostridium estertheticum]MBU3173397.1 hypothetical protein [Clostridium estertheticum]
MKKIMKGLLLVFLVNSVISIGFIICSTFSVVNSSFKGTGIHLTDLMGHSMSDKDYKLLENNMEQSSMKLGKSTAKNVEDVLSFFIPNTKADFSKMPKEPYPYPEVSNISDKEASEAFNKGLDTLKQTEPQNAAAREKGLSLTKDSR